MEIHSAIRVSRDSNDQPTPADPGPDRNEAGDADLLDAYSRAVIGVVETVAPAVVSLTGRRQERVSGSGSGFLIASDGFALTNSHVVGGRSVLVAETADGDRLDARVIGDDPSTDIALLRLAARDLPHVEMGDSAAVKVGQLVIAMGSPLGLQSTVSTGVVSALGRSMRGQDGRLIEDVVQHAAPINPGSSGGPLLDSRARVIGVNTAIIANAQGLGFAVPSSTAQWVVAQLVAHGKVQRRQLGITATAVTLPRALVRELDLLSDLGVEVVEAAPGGLAEQGGIQRGDVLVAVNGRIVESVDDVHRLLSQLPSDAVLELTIVRGERSVSVKLPAQ